MTPVPKVSKLIRVQCLPIRDKTGIGTGSDKGWYAVGIWYTCRGDISPRYFFGKLEHK